MKAVFMGLGYIGLPTSAVAAGNGIHVIGVDVNSDVVDTINAGRIHIPATYRKKLRNRENRFL